MGDKGSIYKEGKEITEVLDTQKTVSEIFFHKIKAVKDFEIKIGDEIVEKIDFKRHRTSVNHAATHVINAALRKFLAKQQDRLALMWMLRDFVLTILWAIILQKKIWLKLS